MGLTELLSFQYLTNIFPSPYPSPPRGEGRVRGTSHGCRGKKDAYSTTRSVLIFWSLFDILINRFSLMRGDGV